MKRLSCAALLLGVLLAAGCGPKTALVRGKVTYRGAPLTSGKVVIMTPDGKASDSGSVQPDGTFFVAHAPRGDVRIAVDNPPPPPRLRTAARPRGMSPNDPELRAVREQARKHVPIPWRFRDPSQSGLTGHLKGGKNELPLELQ
jgi:hypothetical protein